VVNFKFNSLEWRNIVTHGQLKENLYIFRMYAMQLYLDFLSRKGLLMLFYLNWDQNSRFPTMIQSNDKTMFSTYKMEIN
jgi:hypothetical protein